MARMVQCIKLNKERQALRNRCLWRGVLTCVIISVR